MAGSRDMVRPLPRKFLVVTECIAYGDGVVYNAARAKQAHEKIAEMDVENLAEPVKVEVPYTGIGTPPSRPGGDIVAVGRIGLRDLYVLFEKARRRAMPGSRIYISGPVGCGKTVLLRELAVCLLKDSGSKRLVCIWNTDEVLLEQIRLAFCFTYAMDEGALERISKLESQADVEQFMDERIAMQEQFFFIIDGGEVFADLGDRERAQVLDGLTRLMAKSPVSVVCLSPMAEKRSRKRKADGDCVVVNNGFLESECYTYFGDVSLLGRVTKMQDTKRRIEDVEYYVGTHPLSLAVLNNCCWLLAERRRSAAAATSRLFQAVTDFQLTEEEVLWELQEAEDWEEVLRLYVSSEELTRVRLLAREAVSNANGACHWVKSMVKLDMRFVYGDSDLDELDCAPCYVNKYVERIYLEEMRNVEQRTVYKGGAWAAYCKHLLDNSVAVNWSEMGWLCEDFVGEVITLKGLNVEESLKVPKARLERFGTVPSYNTWIEEVKAGGVLIFLPLKYKYGSVDGVLVIQIGGELHFIAIQVTINDDSHRHSAVEFMSWETIRKWIPEEVRSEWNLHYVFLCLRDEAPQDVQEKLKPLLSGGYYGTVAYRLHVVAFTTAFHGLLADDVRGTLQVMAEKRDNANPVAIPQAHPGAGSSALGSTVAQILEWNVFSKSMLQDIAKFHKVKYSQKDTKAVLKGKIVEQPLCQVLLQLLSPLGARKKKKEGAPFHDGSQLGLGLLVTILAASNPKLEQYSPGYLLFFW